MPMNLHACSQISPHISLPFPFIPPQAVCNESSEPLIEPAEASGHRNLSYLLAACLRRNFYLLKREKDMTV